MIKKNQINIGLLLIAFASILFVSTSFFIVKRSINQQGDRTWKKYYPLLVPNGNTGRLIGDVLENKFNVIRYENVLIEYFDFNGFATLLLPEVEDRFTFLDSRYDPYMKNLGNLFRTEDGTKRIIYIRSDNNPIQLFFRLKNILKGFEGDWILLNINWAVRALVVVIFLLLLFFGAFIIQKRKLVIPFLGLPWIPVLFFGELQSVMMGSMIFYAVLLSGVFFQDIIQEYLNAREIVSTKSLVRICAWLWGIVFLFFIIMVIYSDISKRTLGTVGLAAVANISVELILIGSIIFKKGKQIHTLFYHVPLSNSRRIKFRFHRLLPVPVMIAVVIIMPALVSGIAPNVNTLIPQPGEKRFTNLDFDILQEIDGVKSGAALLPGVADYIKHRLFQTGWLYNIPYELPEAGSDYTISTFLKDDEGIHIKKMDKNVVRISNDWYTNEIISKKNYGIMELLLSQPGWSAIEYKNIKQKPFTRIEIIVYYIAWIALQLSGLISYTHLTPITLYDKKAVELRRQCQAA